LGFFGVFVRLVSDIGAKILAFHALIPPFKNRTHPMGGRVLAPTGQKAPRAAHLTAKSKKELALEKGVYERLLLRRDLSSRLKID